jgi:hypothetical protein
MMTSHTQLISGHGENLISGIDDNYTSPTSLLCSPSLGGKRAIASANESQRIQGRGA